MTLMLEFKEKLRKFYIDFSYIILPAAKFLLAFAAFYSINQTIGFLSLFKNIFVVLILALTCCLLPVQAVAIFGGILILGHCYALGIEVAAFALIFILVLGVLFLRFDTKDSLALVLMPFALALGVPCAIPVCFGLKRKPTAAISVACGTMVYYFMALLKEKSTLLKSSDNDIMTKLKLMLDGIIRNRMMFLMILALVVVLILVYLIRRTGKDYAWHAAIVVGFLTYVAVMIGGGLFLDVQTDLLVIFLGALGSLVIALLFGFLVHNVDYSRTERLEFEDDEYYYYVKAVPKMTISKSERQIKTIQDEETDIPENMGDAQNEDTFGANRERMEIDENDLERKLEESLKNL